MKIKTISKRALTLLLTLLMLMSSMTIGITAPSAAEVELAPTGGNITNLNFCYLVGSHQGWNTGDSNWKLSTSDNNKFTGTFYVPYSSSSYEIKYYMGKTNDWNGWFSIGDKEYNSTTYTFSNQAIETNKGNDKVKCISSTSGYIKWDVTFYGAYSSNSYSSIKQTAVTALGGSVSANSTTVHPGDTVTLTPTGTGGSGKYSYSYAKSGGTLSATSGSSTVFTAPNVAQETTYTITTTIKDANSQLSGLTAKTVTTTIKVVPNTVTATFKDYDGTVLDTDTVTSGSTPTYGGDTPTRDGYNFTGWSPAIGAITSDTIYTAQYSKKTYTVSVSVPANSGNSTASADKSSVEHGSSVKLTANADTANEYVFTGWTVNGVDKGLTNPLTISNVTANISAVANFEQIPSYNVTATVGLTGAGTASASSSNVPQGSLVNLQATENDGYTFTGWTINGTYTLQSGTVSDKSVSIIVNSTITATANYRANTGKVIFGTSTVGGSVSNNGTNNTTYPGTATSTVTANPGYTFNKWTVAGGTEGTDYEITENNAGKITIKPITDGISITANASFTINKYTVTFVDYDGETVIDTQTVEYGKAATAPANPTRTGYTFKAWDTAFNNITSNTTVKATYTANTYTVSASANAGGSATTSAASVTYPDTVTLTATPESSDYIFTGWDIDGDYEVVSGSEASATFVIRPEDNITATASFALGQYLTVYTYSDDGYKKLTLKESNGTTTKDVLDKVDLTNTAKFNDGVTWQMSDEQELTRGYSSSVKAQLSGEGGVPSGSGNLIVFNNTLGWSSVHLYTSSGNLWNGDNGCTTNGATHYTMTKITGTNYWYAYVSNTASILFMKDQQNNYNNIHNTAASYRTDYSSSNPTFTPNTTSNQSTNGTTYYSNGNWSAAPTINASSAEIDITSKLYKDGAWLGNSEVWIYQNGNSSTVTLRRSLLDLITETTAEYNGGTNSKDYTTTSWNNFVTAYTNAKSVSGAKASTQTAIDDAKSALDAAYKALELQAYYTVSVTQNMTGGTVKVGTTTIDTTTGSAQVTQGSTASVTVTAPAGYYIKSITGDVTASNQASPYTASLVVNSDKSFTVTYATNPKVTITVLGGEGTQTINGGASPQSITYNKNAELVFNAADGYYIGTVKVDTTPVYSNSVETENSYTYTLENVTKDTTVMVTYIARTEYTVRVNAYNSAEGTLTYNGKTLNASGDTITTYAGETVVITATPKANYAVGEWTLGGTAAGSANTLTISNINGNKEVGITFDELDTFNVTIAAKPYAAGTATATSGSLTASTTGTKTITILEGDQVTLKATVTDGCYEFSRWNISGTYTIVSGSTGSTEFKIVPTSTITATATYLKVYNRVYLKNDAGWSQPHLHYWGGSEGPSWPGNEMTYDSTLELWVGYIDPASTGIQFNDGTNQNQHEPGISPTSNIYNNGTGVWSGTYVEPGYYLQGTWNGKNYSAYDQQKFYANGDGTYSIDITVTSTSDGYIYVNPTNQDSHFWNALTANATGNPQTLNALGAYTATPNRVKVEIDTNDHNKDYDVTFTFNPTTGAFSWTKAEAIETITVRGTDGRTKNEADSTMVSSNGRVGDTYFDNNTIVLADEHTYYTAAEVVTGNSVTFFTQVNPTSAGVFDYYVAGWVINGTEFTPASALGNGLYSGSYTFTEDNTTVVPVYFHTQEWLTANGVDTVTVYAVGDKGITNWDQYMSAYTWYKTSGTTVYAQFGAYTGQLMIPVSGLDGVYYTYIETTSPDDVAISGVTFSNHGDAENDYDVSAVTNYHHIQTYDYYEFISLLGDGKQNITFVLKDTNDTYNSNRTSTSSINISSGNWDFVQYTDYSNLKIDVFGNNIENIDATLSDSNALYIVQAGDKNYSGVGNLDGQWYVDCYLYNSSGVYLGKCYSYELHDEDSAIWATLAAYENQRAYISYEHVNGGRYDGEWYGDANVSVTINIGVNVGLTTDDGKTFTEKTSTPVNEADYGTGYINATYQNVDVTRGSTVTLVATPKAGYKFVGWYTQDDKLFDKNNSVTITTAIGTTYTAVFEALKEGYFYVNHYLYTGTGTVDKVNIPEAYGGSGDLYVGIQNITQNTSAAFGKQNTAYIEAVEGDKLIITIATDPTGADKFFAWYVDAIDKNGLTSFEEVGVDSVDNLYNNNGTVIGRNDMVYFQFEYIVKDEFSVSLYSNIKSVSINATLVYKYNDRYGNPKSYYVPIILTAKEIEGFAGNNNTPYTPAYISGDGWVNTVLANAPYIEDFYKDSTWVINSTYYTPLVTELWATQNQTYYSVTVMAGDEVVKKSVPFNSVITLDASEYVEGAGSGLGFWYKDTDKDGLYTEDVDVVLSYNTYFGYRITEDVTIGYKLQTGLDFMVTVDTPVYGREQTTDSKGNVTSDKVYVDYILNLLVPYLYGYPGWTDAPIYGGETINQNWNGSHVTIESLRAKGYTVDYGMILEQVGSFKVGDGEKYATYEEALAAAQAKGYGNFIAEDSVLIDKVQNGNGYASGTDTSKYYYKYNATNTPTNMNRVMMTFSYSNTVANRGKFFNAYGYLAVTDPNTNETKYYFSTPQAVNIYNAGTSDAVVEDNDTFA